MSEKVQNPLTIQQSAQQNKMHNVCHLLKIISHTKKQEYMTDMQEKNQQ